MSHCIITIGANFGKTTQRIKDMMTKDGGGLQWSTDHNSRFEVSKSAIAHFSRKTISDPDSNIGHIPIPRPALILENQMVQEVSQYKYLGIQIDTQLKWKEQGQHAAANTTNWILQFCRLSKPSTGVGAKLMRQLYLVVALPKITYRIDIWYTPPEKPTGFKKSTCLVSALHSLQKTQRIATLAIIGTLRSTPNNYIDIYAGIFPIELALLRACHNSLLCMLTLPEHHPLHRIIQDTRHSLPTKHPSPINLLIK